MTANEEWPDLAGRLTGFGHALGVRVYYEDTDFSGRVYHASYLRFMERGRSDFLRLIGIAHHELARGEAGEPLAFAVAKMAVDFRRAAGIDDVLAVETRVQTVGGAHVVLAQRVMRGAETLVTAELTSVLLSAGGKPRRFPRAVRARLLARSPT